MKGVNTRGPNAPNGDVGSPYPTWVTRPGTPDLHRLTSVARSARYGMELDQRKRLMIAVPLGVAVAAGLATTYSWQLSVLCGWDATALTLVGTIWSFLPFADEDQTESFATREDDSRAVVDVIMVLASVVSLVGVVAGLHRAGTQHGPTASALTAISVFTVFLSWLTVHTLFTLRYAHLYFSDVDGGITFANAAGGDQRPDYLDFVYLAFTVGMTFQVSDTGIGKRSIRRAVTRHALLSFMFGTVIVGVTISVLGNLIR
jgi:uncharacterized membrane protein